MYSPVVTNTPRQMLSFEDSPVAFGRSICRNIFGTEKNITPLNGKFNIYSDCKSALCFQNSETPQTIKSTKRRCPSSETTPAQPSKRRYFTDTCKTAVEDMSRNDKLCGDASSVHSLPVVEGKHKDLKSITHQTLSDLMDHKYADIVDNYTIIDCRYPYEYEAGHIKGAVNLYTKDTVETMLSHSKENTVLVFHCEFSSERGPKMLRHLRAKDRQLNAENYPHLNYPEIYLLEGGYKQFFTNESEQCFPRHYKPMLHKDNQDDLRYFRSKTKSRKTNQRKRCLRFLSWSSRQALLSLIANDLLR